MLRFYTGIPFDGHNFAILMLEKEVSLNSMAKVVKLPDEDLPCPEGKGLMASGWGLSWIEGYGIDNYQPIVLKQTRLMCLDPTEYCPGFAESAHTLCVGDPKTPLNSPCGGDSGGTKSFFKQFNFFGTYKIRHGYNYI